MSEIIEAELVPAVDEKLVKYAGQTGLEKPATETLMEAFRPVFLKARGALADAAGVAASVKDATCVTEIKKSRACRLAIRAVRLEGETVHKKQKESALRFGRAVDGFRNILLADLEPVENALQDAEDTAERAEAARKAALKAEREAELRPFLDGPDAPFLSDLSNLTEKAYAELFANYKLLRQAKIDAAAKAEAERLAKEKADREERERMAAENARLQAEAAEARRLAEVERIRIEAERVEERRKTEAEAARVAEISRKELEAIEAKAKAAAAKAKAEREALEAKARQEAAVAAQEAEKLRAELAAKAQAEAEQKAKTEAEAKAAALAARRAAAAPDKAKLLAFTTTLRTLERPSFADETLNQELSAEVTRLIRWINDKAQGLS